ncbi:MAG TPA: FkbM family methyltransferase [Pyrinomonadaceae bacterium]
MAALHYGGDAARAVAVDPSPTAARMLKIQARLNRVEERLTVVRSAVGEHVGWQPMVPTGVNGAGYFVAPGDHSGGEVVKTRSTTLDRLAEDLRLTPTHLKIDVEGYEQAVLSGGRRLLARHAAPLLFLELHNEMIRERGGDPSETLSLLKAFGYVSFSPYGTRLSDGDILSRPLLRIVGKKAEHL